MIDTVDESNFLLVAAKAYNNPNCIDIIEFYKDLEHIKHIKKIINRFNNTGKINIRLYLNHFICLYNVFDHALLTRMLCFRLYNDIEMIKPILELLGYWQENIGPIGMRKEMIFTNDVRSNEEIAGELKKI